MYSQLFKKKLLSDFCPIDRFRTVLNAGFVSMYTVLPVLPSGLVIVYQNGRIKIHIKHIVNLSLVLYCILNVVRLLPC